MDILQLIVVFVSLLGLSLAGFSLWRSHRLNRLTDAFFSETGHHEFGEVLLSHQRHLRRTDSALKSLDQRLSRLEHETNFLLNQVGLVKYNPFADSGGNMSFSLALLNNNGDGAVVTSLHSREGIRLYSKTVKGYQSEQTLTEEESQAIAAAKRSL
jgi:hypothetical protein